MDYGIHTTRSDGYTACAEPEEQPLVSIIVLAYNHLEYTKKCIGSLFQYTSHIKFELITVNNGSTDGTTEYFNTLPNHKKIHLETNVGPVNGFNVGMKEAKAKYTACVCNDIILTTRWLDNLLQCMESDPQIGIVVPGASYLSNYQQINGNYDTLDEMQQFAREYNQSDPQKWEDRLRVLPCILFARTELLKSLGYYDPQFFFGEFSDDDISFRVRRAGYRLIYARDTFIYHFGSVTTYVEHNNRRSLEISREIFFRKYGIDAWDDACFNPYLVERVKCIQQSSIQILGLNTFCGGTPQQIKNKYRAAGINDVKIYSITDEEKYLIDLKTASDQAVLGAIHRFAEIYPGKRYDCVVIEKGLEKLEDAEGFFAGLKSVLKEGGRLLFTVNNDSYHLNLIKLLSGGAVHNDSQYSYTYINRHRLISLLKQLGFKKVQLHNCWNPVRQVYKELLENMVNLGVLEDRRLSEDIFNISQFIFDIES